MYYINLYRTVLCTSLCLECVHVCLADSNITSAFTYVGAG